nr:hypothetical protein [Laspinema sp. D2d]
MKLKQRSPLAGSGPESGDRYCFSQEFKMALQTQVIPALVLLVSGEKQTS